jgi:hypothetical protein
LCAAFLMRARQISSDPGEVRVIQDAK